MWLIRDLGLAVGRRGSPQGHHSGGLPGPDVGVGFAVRHLHLQQRLRIHHVLGSDDAVEVQEGASWSRRGSEGDAFPLGAV